LSSAAKRRLALLLGVLVITASQPAMADCGLNVYPPLSPYGYDSDQCKMGWQLLDWNKVIQACSTDAQDAAAERQDFTSLTIAAQSLAKVAIAYDKIGQSERASRERAAALAQVKAAVVGFEDEQPTPDDEGAASAKTLQAAIAAPNFFSSAGCAP
jgi:hypothetical protein